MEAKTALAIALGLALGLPYLTVALMQGGRFGFLAVGVLFIGAFLLVVISDLRESDVSGETPKSD
ncbi:MAG: hypothetical protein ACI80F_002171 [Natronomonas sp.]|jgi:hypothetical protein|uniref:hypothetical protein n=1 Tax=Natronomonas sp. TaxID=2184060 RepID=UPI003989447A